MKRKQVPVPDCRKCLHWKEPANCPVCIDCWSYQRGKNFVPADSGHTLANADRLADVLDGIMRPEVVMTANLREWRHFFRLRCSGAAHPQMREVAMMALRMFREKVPVVFDDVGETNGET